MSNMRLSIGQKLVSLSAWLMIMFLSLFAFGLIIFLIIFVVSAPVAIRIATA